MVFITHGRYKIKTFSARKPPKKTKNYFEINRELAERIEREFGHDERFLTDGGFLIYDGETHQALGASLYVINDQRYVYLDMGMPQLILRNIENFDKRKKRFSGREKTGLERAVTLK